jgi:hypothetical protein
VSAKRVVAALVAFAGASAFTTCLLALVNGMRDVMQTDGGFCASGGPYVIARQCSNADIRLIMIGIFGALLAAGFYAGGTAGIGSRGASAGLLLWAALFGTLGWTFVSTGRHSGASSLLLVGVLFLAMAAGGLLPLLFSLAGDLRSAGRPSPAVPGMQPLVRAAVPAAPGLPPGGAGSFQPASTGTWQPGMVPTPGMTPAPGMVPGPGTGSAAASRSTELLRTAVWLIVSLAGTAVGIALSASLISVLR